MASPFADPIAISAARRSRAQRTIVGLVVFVVVLALGAVAFASVAGSSGPHFRTAVAGIEDVRSTIDGVASIEPVGQATVAFPVAGTVKSVSVVNGDTVRAGQSIATMDPTSLEQSLHKAEATLANAQLTLQKAIDAQDAATSTTSTSSTEVPVASSSTTTPGGSIQQQIAAAQRAVIQAQQGVDRAMATAAAKVTASQTACATVSTPTQITTCQNALHDVTVAQASVQTAQQQLSTATTQLDSLLNQQARTTTTTTPGGGGGGTGFTTTTSGTGGGSSSSGGGSGRTPTAAVPTAADIAADQAAVDSAQAAVNVAEQNLKMTNLVSPIDGTVVSTAIAAGQTVTANSTSATIVIVGPGGFEATMVISVDLIPRVRVGQDATVLPDGAVAPVAARVVQVSIAPASSTTATAVTYRVTLSILGSSDKLQNGAIATASILTASAGHVLAVPTSAIHFDAAGARAVTVMDGSATTEVAVTIGILGNEYTQITDGLVQGAVVVIADLRTPLPGAATTKRSTTNSSTVGAPGGQNFPGGNLPTGGFQPGGQAGPN